MMEPDPREARLPRWAQSELRVLRDSNEYLERKIEGLVRPVEEGAVVVNLGPDRDMSLPDDTRVSFRMEEDGRTLGGIQIVLREDGRGRYLDIHGGTTLSVEPAASNHLELRLVPRW